MSTVYYDNINGFSQLKMENGKLYGRLNSGEWKEIETGGEQGEPGAPGADGVSAYVYWAWCADPATGAGFSLTNPADYISFITRNTVLVSPQFSDFSTWVKYVGSDGKDGTDGVSTYVYYAYASDDDGTNFSLSPADGLNYQAILVTHTEIASPSLSDFAGMFYQYKAELENYLQLSGGTMTGNVFWNAETGFGIRQNSSGVDIGWSWGDRTGSGIGFRNADYTSNPGGFCLFARDAANSTALDGFADGRLQWGGQSVLNPIGTVIAFAGNSAPAGYLICNGAAVNRTTYAKLFAIIGTTYGEGDGSTTFNLPNLANKFIMGSSTAGTWKAPGLPNITGSTNLRRYVSFGNSYVGALATGSTTVTIAQKYIILDSTTSTTIDQIQFDASKSSSIYGNSSTVQPPAVTMRFYIKY